MTDFGRRSGDMLKSVYDTNDDGLIDNSAKLQLSDKSQVQDHPPADHTHNGNGGEDNEIIGDGTLGRVLRVSNLVLKNGTDPNTLKNSLLSNWNGDIIAETDNIPKDGTEGHFTLNAGGSKLTIAAEAFTGNVVAVLAAVIRVKAGTTDITCRGDESSNRLVFQTYDMANGSTTDITALVASGDINVLLTYLTDA